MYTRQVEVLFSNQFGESNNCPIFHPQYQNVLFWLAFTREWKGVCVCVCVCYEAEMAALSLACCSLGSDVIAA